MKQTRAKQMQGRTFNLHARFSLDGPEQADFLAFQEFCLAAKSQAQERKRQGLAQREARLAKLKAAKHKVSPLVREVLGNRLSIEAAARQIQRLVPDRELAKKLLKISLQAAKATPEKVARQTADIQRREAELRRSARLLKAREHLSDGLALLTDAAMAGDAAAAAALADMALHAAGLLLATEIARPELLKPIARRRTHWPVLAHEEAGWERQAVRRVAKLELGAELQVLKVRFRKARGTEANLPARQWAKAAVRTVEETRRRTILFGQLVRAFGSADALAGFCCDVCWRPAPEPNWARAALKLEPFSMESLPYWKAVVRELIREQVPDFQTRPEWENQRRTATHSGRDTPGEIQNAILDDIVSALKRLAPAKAC